MDTTEYTKIKYALHLQRKFICVDDNPLLGEGAFGQVVKAMCSKTGEHQGKMFAIKIMAYHEGDKKRVRYQDREIEALIRLGPPENSNVIKYFDSWVMIVGHEQKLCIQMELCADNLLTFVHRNPMALTHDSPRFYRQVFQQILNGLVFIHSAGWVHRDIHPGNIFIVNPNPQRISDIHVKIGDFGLARYININIYLSSDYTKRVKFEKLTPLEWQAPYTAPELKNDTYDFKVDVYSAGTVLYFISRRYPVQKHSILKQEIENIKQGKVDINDCIYHKDDKTLSSLIQKMVEQEPKDRPSAREARDYMFPEAKDFTYFNNAVNINFFAKKENEKLWRVFPLKEFTFSALTAEVKRRIDFEANKQQLVQKRMNGGKTTSLAIDNDEDVAFVFRDAEQEAKEHRYVELVVIEKEKEDSNIELEPISSGDVSMKSQPDSM